MTTTPSSGIKAIDRSSVHQITSGQVVVDLQTAVKELVENSLDAGATNIEVRFKDYGLTSVEVIDNGSGIPPEDYQNIGLKHYTSKLETFEDISAVETFGFRGEALSSLCALCAGVSVTTATVNEAPMGTIIELERSGKVARSDAKVARQRGTTVAITKLFAALPVRRKELERNAKREFGKALNLLHAYALVPCANENKGVRLTVSNQAEGGKRIVQLRSDGSPSTRASVSALWGPKALENIVELDLQLSVQPTKSVLKRIASSDSSSTTVCVKGLVSKFAVACGRAGTDRQFFFINGRPCAPSKVQKAFNEVYRSFNATQSPFIVADFQLPPDSCDINVSPDKRTILIHSEENLIQALKLALEEAFAPERSTYNVNDPTATPSRRKLSTIARILESESTGQIKPPVLEPETDGDRSSDPPPAEPGPSSPLAEVSEPPPRKRWSEEQAVNPVPIEPPVNVAHSPRGSALMPRPGYLTGCEAVVDTTARTVRYTHVEVPIVDDDPADEGASMAVDVESEAELSFGTFSLPQSYNMADSSSQPLFLPSRSVSPTTSTTDKRNLDSEDIPRKPQPFSQPAQFPSPASSRPRASSPSPVVAVLSTSNAAWNRRRSVADLDDTDTNGDSSRPQKRARREDDGDARTLSVSTLASTSTGKGTTKSKSPKEATARGKLRQQLLNFARAGSQVAPIEVESDDDHGNNDGPGDDEGAEQGRVLSGTTVDDPIAVDDIYDKSHDGPPTELSPSIGDIFKDRQDVSHARIHPSATMARIEHGPLEAETTMDIDDNLRQGGEDGEEEPASPVEHQEVIRTDAGGGVVVRLDLSKITQTWLSMGEERRIDFDTSSSSTRNNSTPSTVKDAGLANTSDEAATRALARIISKDDFARMECLGQFNHGFIIARRRALPSLSGEGKQEGSEGRNPSTQHDDLFIIDQHASDEKYNFETLQKTDKISSQKLFKPIPLELTAADELLALENLAVLQANGFEVSVDEDALPGRGERIKVTAQPVNKTTVFGIQDLEELLHLMRDVPSGTMVRCSKARAMYASRACRKSVMVGMPLKKSQMTKVMRHMGTIEQPWNCPHGRPTMRHLINLAEVTDRDWSNRPINWEAFTF